MITDLIRELVIYGKNNGLICEADEVYATNRLLELFDVMEYEENPEITESRAVCEILEDMMTYAHENGIMKEDTITAKDLFDTKIMGCITPPPSVVRAEFAKRYAENPKEATEYYYQFSQATNYIRKDRIAKDENMVRSTSQSICPSRRRIRAILRKLDRRRNPDIRLACSARRMKATQDISHTRQDRITV